MNTNFLHNILNVAFVVIAMLSTPELMAILPPELAVKLAGVLGAVKLGINALRDGIGGLTKNQPPVK